MAKRDPIKTLRNKKIREITTSIKELLPDVLFQTGLDSDNRLATSTNGTKTIAGTTSYLYILDNGGANWVEKEKVGRILKE